MKHPYADLIKAAADGTTVQFREKFNGATWRDWIKGGYYFPHFSSEFEWRVKPDTLRYRVALMKGESSSTYWIAALSIEETEQHPSFVRWLHDWQEVEV
jgi:hypothetical protein